jgi:hypothetical protein
MRIGSFIVVVWLLIGVFATYQRGYFASTQPDCATVGSIAMTILVGPLNYAGVNPRVEACNVPQPDP